MRIGRVPCKKAFRADPMSGISSIRYREQCNLSVHLADPASFVRFRSQIILSLGQSFLCVPSLFSRIGVREVFLIWYERFVIRELPTVQDSTRARTKIASIHNEASCLLSKSISFNVEQVSPPNMTACKRTEPWSLESCALDGDPQSLVFRSLHTGSRIQNNM